MPAKWIQALGIRDAASGAAAGKAAREKILEPARAVIGSSDEVENKLVIFQGFVARAQGLHDAAVQAIEAENPHAAFTLLRAYAENAAAILYAKDKPTLVEHFLDPDNRSLTIGKITNHARTRFGGFTEIYDQLSKFAHPQAVGLLESTSVTEDHGISWASKPRFKRPDDQLLAYAWSVELAEATRHLLYEFAETYGLGYLGGKQATDAGGLLPKDPTQPPASTT